MERTFCMIKPDAVERRLVGEIISRLEHKGLTIRALKQAELSRELAEANYEEHRDRPFYPELVRYVTQGPVVLMILEGEGAIAIVRKLIGATNPAESEPGTIRGDFGLAISGNIVHGSDSAASAAREIGLFFGPDEV